MRLLASLAVLLLAASAAADPAPRKPARVCVADSPEGDKPCTGFQGKYHVRILPFDGGEPCHVKAPLEADITIGKPLQHGHVVVDARALVKKLGWKPRKEDAPEAGAAIRKGVCCIDVEVHETTGTPDSEIWNRLIVHIARGATKATGVAQERILHDKGGGDCQHDLAVEVTPRR